jgi:hypothetical protein
MYVYTLHRVYIQTLMRILEEDEVSGTCGTNGGEEERV